MDEELEVEVFDVAFSIYLQGWEESLSVMGGIHVPADRSLYTGKDVADVAEDLLESQQLNSAQPWLRFEATNGDRTLIYKDQIQAIKFLMPNME